jgi:hypothetical protein
MAVIKVTQADLVANKIIGPVWVDSVITKVEGPFKASSGKSHNYFVTFTFGEDCEAPGKEVRICYNDTRGLGNLYPVFAAVRGVSLSKLEVGTDLDTDELLNCELAVNAVPGVNNNQTFQDITNYLPVGKGDKEASY